MNVSMQTTSARNPATSNFTFKLNRQKQPIKLGDGTYGAVFEGRTEDNKRVALKVFYPQPRSSEDNRRNALEMRSGVEVRKALRNKNLDGLESNLVLSQAWTTRFTESDAFRTLDSAFQQLGVAVSDRALAMPYFECTLKDVLETGAPKGRLVDGDPQRAGGQPGYQILRSMALPLRERALIGIVAKVVEGLRALHAADLFHHDIKPANVMMRSSGASVDVAVGDFGFLRPSLRRAQGGYGASVNGTRHYRSPEQKDSFDLCDVSVKVNDKEDTLILETRDRKFRDTLIETGDLALFSKDKEQVGHEILSIDSSDANKIRITLKRHRDIGVSDPKTQVIFFKRPSPRTDLFGVGALLFDLLTAGKSPECFYDYLRPFDRDDEDGRDVVSVSTILDRYLAAASANSTSAEFAPLFEQLRDSSQGTMPSPDIVTILLKCMLSRTPGSYFREETVREGKFDRQAVFSSLYGDIAAFSGSDVPSMSSKNPIWVGARTDYEFVDSPPGFTKCLEEVHAMSSGPRMAWAVLRTRQLTDMIGAIRKRHTFFTDLSPANLRFEDQSTQLSAVVESHESEDDHLRAVRSGLAWRIGTTGDADNFIPIYRRFGARSVDVSGLHTKNGEDGLEASFRYTESLPVWRGCHSGDLLRAVDSRGRVHLYRVLTDEAGAGVWKTAQVSELSFDDSGVHSQDPQPEPSKTHPDGDPTPMRGMIVSRLVPTCYYLSIMTTYIHQLFFVDNEHDDGAIPDVVWSCVQALVAGELDLTKHKKPSSLWNRLKRNVSVSDVKSLAAEVYLDLLLVSESRNANTSDPDKAFATLVRHTLLLEDAVARLVGYADGVELRSKSTSGYAALKVNSRKSPARDSAKGLADYLSDHVRSLRIR